MLKAVVFLYVFHIVYTGVFTGVMISAILLKINYIRGLYVMNELVKEIEQLKKEKNLTVFTVIFLVLINSAVIESCCKVNLCNGSFFVSKKFIILKKFWL